MSLKNNKVVTEIINVQGRKIPINEIRIKMLNHHKKYMHVQSNDTLNDLSLEHIKTELIKINEYCEHQDEKLNKEDLLKRLTQHNTTRHLMMWHDGSSLASHGYLLLMVATMYDRALHISESEFKDEFGLTDIQSFIEKPFMYLIARCPSNNQQILYTKERMDDLHEIDTSIMIGDVPIKDVVRVFKGDKPAAQFEAGQQKGGNDPCFCCSINANLIPSFVHSSSLPYTNIEDRLSELLLSERSQNQSKMKKMKVFEKLKKHEIVEELNSRNIKFTCEAPVLTLQSKIEDTMHGIQRVPALMYEEPLQGLNFFNLNNYEILSTEPLHDVSNHIKNLYVEIPLHAGKQRKQLEEIIELSFHGKEAKNGADHRKSLLIVTCWLIENMCNHFITKLFESLAKIQEILYLQDHKRTVQKILRLRNVTFQHAMIIKINIRGNLKKLTSRKFFGVYFHSLIHHAPLQFRLISGRTANTEKEESTFSHLKKITKLTSNHHADNILVNLLIRIQANYIMKGDEIQLNRKNLFEKLYKPIKMKQTNTLISYEWIKSAPSI